MRWHQRALLKQTCILWVYHCIILKILYYSDLWDTAQPIYWRKERRKVVSVSLVVGNWFWNLLHGLSIREGFKRKASMGAEIGKTVSWWWVSLFLVALYRGLREWDGLFQQVTAWEQPRGHGDLGMRRDHWDIIAMRCQGKLVSSVLTERGCSETWGYDATDSVATWLRAVP